MKEITDFFKQHIEPHAQWEERVLYPAVDERAGGKTGARFTSTMRNDHRIVGRRIKELEEALNSRSPDAREFVRKTDRLLGLITAHFENEEEILLPVLDKSMSRDEFEREIMGKTEHG